MSETKCANRCGAVIQDGDGIMYEGKIYCSEACLAGDTDAIICEHCRKAFNPCLIDRWVWTENGRDELRLYCRNCSENLLAGLSESERQRRTIKRVE